MWFKILSHCADDDAFLRITVFSYADHKFSISISSLTISLSYTLTKFMHQKYRETEINTWGEYLYYRYL